MPSFVTAMWSMRRRNDGLRSQTERDGGGTTTISPIPKRGEGTVLPEKNHLAKADRDRGMFRTFLLGSLKNFLVNEWKRAGRLKRGGDLTFLSIDANVAEDRYAAEPANESNPDAAYEQRWAVTLIEQVLATLRRDYSAADKGRLFEELKGFIWGDKSTASYAEIAGHLNLTEGTVKVAVHRLRQRFRELLRAEVAHTVARPEDIDGELRHLIAVVR